MMMENEVAFNPTDDQKLFVVLAVATATICFLTNSILGLIFICYHLLGSFKNLLFLNQAITGLFTTFTIIYPIKLISIKLLDEKESAAILPPSDLEFFANYSSCYLLSSGLLILCMFATLVNNALLALDHYILIVQPSKYLTWRSHSWLWGGLVGFVWVESVLMGLLPWMGWNNWHDFCYIPGIWTSPYFGVVGFLFFAHIIVFIYMFVGIFVRSRVGVEPMTEIEEMPICENPIAPGPSGGEGASDRGRAYESSRTGTSYEPNNFRLALGEAKARFGNFLVILVCYMPIMLHLLARTGKPIGGAGHDMAVLGEKDLVLPWAALLVVLCGVLSPIIYIFTDDDLSNATIMCLKAFCCCQCRPRSNVVTPTTGDNNE